MIKFNLMNLIKTILVSGTLRTVVVELLYFSYAFRVTNAHFIRELNNTTRQQEPVYIPKNMKHLAEIYRLFPRCITAEVVFPNDVHPSMCSY